MGNAFGSRIPAWIVSCVIPGALGTVVTPPQPSDIASVASGSVIEIRGTHPIVKNDFRSLADEPLIDRLPAFLVSSSVHRGLTVSSLVA